MSAVNILGVHVDAVTAAEAVVRLREGLDQGQRQYVVTVNPEIIMVAQPDLAYKEVLNQAALRLPDGAGTVWASKFLHLPLHGPFKSLRAYGQALRILLELLVWPARVKTVITETVPGSALTEDLAGMCEEFGYRLFLLGGGDGVAETAAAKLHHTFPGLTIVGAMAGSPQASHDRMIRAHLKKTNPDVVLVAYGAPKQEQWIARNLPHLPKPVVAMGVGGTFDYLAGASSVLGGGPAKPPPRVFRRRGLEWLWRLLTQPGRWRRIKVALLDFVRAVIRSKLHHHAKN